MNKYIFFKNPIILKNTHLKFPRLLPPGFSSINAATGYDAVIDGCLIRLAYNSFNLSGFSKHLLDRF